MADEKHNLITWLGFNRQFDFSKHRNIGGLIGSILLLLATGTIVAVMIQFALAVLNIDDFDGADAKHEAIRNTGLVLAAIIGVPFVIWRAVVAQKTVDVAEQNLIVDQINKAVENLVANKEDATPDFVLRVSGILSLVQIAKNDPFTARQCEQILLRYIDVRVGKRNFLDRSESSRLWGPIIYDINNSARYGADWKNKAHDVLSAFEALEEIKSQWT